jgi:hypothetical protein
MLLHIFYSNFLQTWKECTKQPDILQMFKKACMSHKNSPTATRAALSVCLYVCVCAHVCVCVCVCVCVERQWNLEIQQHCGGSSGIGWCHLKCSRETRYWSCFWWPTELKFVLHKHYSSWSTTTIYITKLWSKQLWQQQNLKLGAVNMMTETVK